MCTFMASRHHSMLLLGCTYLLNTSGSRRIFVAVSLALFISPLYFPCVFLFRTKLSRNTSAEICTMPTCSPAVSISKDMKTTSPLLCSSWVSFDRPFGTSLPAPVAAPPPPTVVHHPQQPWLWILGEQRHPWRFPPPVQGVWHETSCWVSHLQQSHLAGRG